MKHFNDTLMRINLQLFAEGGAGDGGNGAEGTGATEAVAAPQQRVNSKNPLADMVYGKQAESAVQPTSQAQEETITPEQLSSEFKELTKKGGKYADQFRKATEGIVKNRLRGTKEQVAKLEALTPTIELLAQKYGVDSGDKNFVEALNRAIEEDDTFYADEAAERGISVEELKHIKRLERDNAALRRVQHDIDARIQFDERVKEWSKQAEEAQKIYPSLDLMDEMSNPQFFDLLMNNIDVKTAYKVIHDDELTAAAMQFAAKTVEKKVVNSMAANAKRPNENGVSATNSQIAKRDVASLTRADRDEIRRRVARGEEVSF
ncbi:hypothetical protein [Ruminococcus sp.]|uniref:hypothetical protein n=1 Tax=Ruminococcus sp. TaxID=41978 RepID=UPI00388EACB4